VRRCALRVLPLLIVLAVVVPSPAGARTSTGVVVVDTTLGFQAGAAAGTAMVLTPSGELLTNNHVIAGATAIRVTVPSSGRRYSAHVVGYDVADDVAVLQLSAASTLATISTGTASTLGVGDRVTAVGNADGAGRLSSARGTVTRLGRSITARDDQGRSERLTGLIETGAPVRPGDSGGPLVDVNSRVVGMVTAATRRFGFPGAGAAGAYAIPIGKVLAIARQIEARKASARIHLGATPFLGVQVGAVDAGSPSASGAVIGGVVPNGPADNAGLSRGDVIVTLGGRTVSSPADIPSILLTRKPGNGISVVYVDVAGRRGSTVVKLGSGPPQ
jgi:S1-C subfamily serine protease